MSPLQDRQGAAAADSEQAFSCRATRSTAQWNGFPNLRRSDGSRCLVGETAASRRRSDSGRARRDNRDSPARAPVSGAPPVQPQWAKVAVENAEQCFIAEAGRSAARLSSGAVAGVLRCELSDVTSTFASAAASSSCDSTENLPRLWFAASLSRAVAFRPSAVAPRSISRSTMTSDASERPGRRVGCSGSLARHLIEPGTLEHCNGRRAHHPALGQSAHRITQAVELA